jgi:hypothetical protein
MVRVRVMVRDRDRVSVRVRVRIRLRVRVRNRVRVSNGPFFFQGYLEALDLHHTSSRSKVTVNFKVKGYR